MRQSAFRGTWAPNRRPFVSYAPDAYVAFQGETETVVCGDCQHRVNFNDYVTGISTEASVDSPPGSATINLSIPDNDANEFFVDGQLVIIEMMEVEIYAKGYYLIGGMPQYYRIFWGLVQSVQKGWSNGTTSITINCKDILRWWEITNVTQNPAFTEPFGSSAGGYQLFQNQFAGQNPYATIIQLARDAMGDFFLTTSSFTSFIPERGAESGVIGAYAKDVMAYWQLKFSNIQANLVLYGASGQAYSFSGIDGTVSPNQVARSIFDQEYQRLKSNLSTTMLFSNPKEVATAKIEVPRAGDVEFFQNETQSKLSIALQARDQMLYEFYCDTTGDIIFKPPFYNLNVLPNKPVSWIQDIDIIDDSITDSEAEVVTHVTASGNAFGGVTDWGLNDEITTPRTGVYDYHLLRRYGWRRADLQLEWAGNPRKLFFHLLDWMDRLNTRRQTGTVTIPLRPELRMGFPIWIPKYDSFFYIQGISHQYSPGGQATTTLTLTARRSKFVAPKNIGTIKKTGKTAKVVRSDDATGKKIGEGEDETYEVSFPGTLGSTSGLSQKQTSGGEPAVIRDPKTAKLLGYPNVVMVYRSTLDGTVLSRILETQGKSDAKSPGKKQAQKQKEGSSYTYQMHVDVYKQFWSGDRSKLIARIRAHRYEAGMANTGAYDYAHDESRSIRELTLIPADYITWGPGTDGGPNDSFGATNIEDYNSLLNRGSTTVPNQTTTQTSSQTTLSRDKLKRNQELIADRVKAVQAKVQQAKTTFDTAVMEKKKADKALVSAKKGITGLYSGSAADFETLSSQYKSLGAEVITKTQAVTDAANTLQAVQDELASLKSVQKTAAKATSIPKLNILVRPVSDEFGFEVIGHYRYGRGVFIDRGQMQIPGDKPGTIANQLSVQFAPTSGVLTDGPTAMSTGADAISFASQFESMQPDDYVTGASFKGTPGGTVSDVQTTSAATYTNLVNANRATGLYIEADALRRAKTLGELRPTITLGGFSEAFDNQCSCALSRTSWYTLLPQEFIARVLSGGAGLASGVEEARINATNAEVVQAQQEIDRITSPDVLMMRSLATPGQRLAWDAKYSLYDTVLKRGQMPLDTPQNRQVFVAGSAKKPSGTGLDWGLTDEKGTDFFSVLEEYLRGRFRDEYRQHNAVREDAYTGASRNIEAPAGIETDEQDNLLGDPTNPLFARAAAGDPVALEALQNEANLNFGLPSAAIKDWQNVQANVGKIGSNLTDVSRQLGRLPGTVVDPRMITGGTVSIEPGTPRQQFQPPAPTINNSIINPTQFNSAAGTQFQFRDNWKGVLGGKQT
jgi:hypothetical protein